MRPETTFYLTRPVPGEEDESRCFVSVVIPLLNEQDNIRPLLTAIRNALSGYDYEIIAVDDGSTDHTVLALKKLVDDRLKVIVMMRNYGQTSAMAAGIAAASGDYIVTLDGDLQNDPDDITKLLRIAQQGNWDVVAGQRVNRLDGFLLRKFPSRIANAIIRKCTGVGLKDYGCTLKVFKRKIAQNLGLYGELHRFIPVLASLQGARMTEAPVKHHQRLFGKSKYGLGRTTKVISDLLLMVYMQRWMKKPMHLFGTLGSISIAMGVLIVLSQLFLLFSNGIWTVTGILLFVAGIMTILMGFLAEIQMRSYYEGAGKTPYMVREVVEQSENSVTRTVSF